MLNIECTRKSSAYHYYSSIASLCKWDFIFTFHSPLVYEYDKIDSYYKSIVSVSNNDCIFFCRSRLRNAKS